MKPATRIVVSIAAACMLLAAACSAGDESAVGAADICTPASAPPASRVVSDSPRRVVLPELTQPAPCRVEVVSTGVLLRPDPDAARPDPGSRVVRDSRGRLFTANAPGFGGTIAVWDSTGHFVQTLGRPGAGPGELSNRGALSIYIGRDDRLHVRDGGIDWSVFSPELEFERKTPWAAYGGTFSRTVVLDDGSVLSSSPDRSDPRYDFRVITTSGELTRGFGEIGSDLVAQNLHLYGRRIAYGGGETFWAAPASGDGRGYELEEWSTDGRLVRTLVRDVPWFPATGIVHRPAADEPPLPQIGQMHADADGRLYVFGSRPTADWRRIEDPAERDAESGNMLEVFIEVIDTRREAVVVSEMMPLSEATEWLGRGYFPAQSAGWIENETPEGLTIVEIVDYRIVPR